MPNQWYAQVMGEEIGPLSGQQLKQMASENRITPDDLVRKGDSSKWSQADRVSGLFSTSTQQIPNPELPSVELDLTPPTPTPSPRLTTGFQIIHGDTDLSYRVIESISVTVRAATLLSRAPTLEEVNFRLKEEALKYGANAIINVEYDRKFTMSTWKPLHAHGMAVALYSDETVCTTCAEMVKLQATKCRYCGTALTASRPATVQSRKTTRPTKVKTEPKRSRLSTYIQNFLGILFLLFVIGAIEVGDFGMLLYFGSLCLLTIPYTWDCIYSGCGLESFHPIKARGLAYLIVLLVLGVTLGALS